MNKSQKAESVHLYTVCPSLPPSLPPRPPSPALPYLNHASYFFIPADDRVELALLRVSHQVVTILLQSFVIHFRLSEGREGKREGGRVDG